MRVGVYVDAFNLYYGGRSQFGRGASGWKWLDLRALAEKLVSNRFDWTGAEITRVVYCTALVDGGPGVTGRLDQDRYLKALEESGSVDWFELGHYVNRVRRAPLATRTTTGAPRLVKSRWPLMVKDQAGADVADATFVVSIAHREEKGSDVNVASHLLVDLLEGAIDAAIVISNDSDLKFPIRRARERIPVGTVNPSKGHLAGALRGISTQGAGRHWWYQLRASDFRDHQLPAVVNGIQRPADW